MDSRHDIDTTTPIIISLKKTDSNLKTDIITYIMDTKPVFKNFFDQKCHCYINHIVRQFKTVEKCEIVVNQLN